MSAKHSPFNPRNRYLQQVQIPDLSRRLDKSKNYHQFDKSPSRTVLKSYQETFAKETQKKKYENRDVSMNPQVLIEQNRQLFGENQQLNCILSQKNNIIDILELKYSQKVEKELKLMKQLQKEKQVFVSQMIKNRTQKDQTIKQYAFEIDNLQQQKRQLILEFQHQSQTVTNRFKEQFVKEIQKGLSELKHKNKSLHSQRQKYKYQLESKSRNCQQLESQLVKRSNTIQNLKAEIDATIDQKCYEIQNQKQNFQNEMEKLVQESKQEYQDLSQRLTKQINNLSQQLTNANYQIGILKLKNDKILLEKQNLNTQRINHIGKLQEQLLNKNHQFKNKIQRQRSSLKQINHTQIQCINASKQQSINNFALQNFRLLNLCQLKSKQSQNYVKYIDQLRSKYQQQSQHYENIVKELHDKINSNQTNRNNQSQILKVKIANLRQADLESLKKYYENQVQILSNTMVEKDAIIQMNRKKLHQQMRHKLEMRKQFQIQIINLKKKIQQLDIELKNADLNTKNEQKSQSNLESLKEITNNKYEEVISKKQSLFSEEIKNLQVLINSKDNQIKQLENKIKLMKQNHQLQIAEKNRQNNALGQRCQLIENENKQNQQYFNNQLNKKKQSKQKDLKQLSSDKQKMEQQLKKQIKALDEKGKVERNNFIEQINNLKNSIIKLKGDIETINAEHKISQQQLLKKNLTSQKFFEENLKKQKQVLINHYDEVLKGKKTQIQDFKQLTQELSNDLRDSKINYNIIQKKLEQSIQNYSQLRQLQSKVIDLGSNQNLLANKLQIN